jgi:hypothetical protein
MHIEREFQNLSVLAKVTQVNDVAHGPLVLKHIQQIAENYTLHF